MAATAAGAQAPPNVVVILADDVGFGDVSFTHSLYMTNAADHPPEVHTPNLDKLAREGIIFSNGYVNGNVCSPTRAAFMLGRQQQRVGIYDAGEGGRGMRVLADAGGGVLTNVNPIFPDWLKNGAPSYLCGVFGKWHLGLDEVYNTAALTTSTATSYVTGGPDGYGLPVNGPLVTSSPGGGSPWHPLNRGFDVSYNFMDRGAHDYWDPNNIYTGREKSGGLDARVNPGGGVDADDPYTLWGTGYVINTNRIPANYLTVRLANEACAFITNSVAGGRPFFCYVPFNAAHSPSQAPYHMDSQGNLETLGTTNGSRYHNVDTNAWYSPTAPDPGWFPDPIWFYETYGTNISIPAYLNPATPAEADDIRRMRSITLAMIAWLDKGVGRIVQTLKEQGVYENTLIVFFSDNGGATAMRASNKPLRGNKATNWEGGIREPFCFNWPAYLNSLPPDRRGGRVIAAPVIAMDILPTALDAAGITNRLPSYPGLDYSFDGKSWLPLIAGTVTNLHDSLFWSEGSTGAGAVRIGNWKLFIDQTNYQLFDLGADVSETTNLAAQHPEVVRQLRQKYYEMMVAVAEDAGETPRLWTTVTPPPTSGYLGLMTESFDYPLGDLNSQGGGSNWPAPWTAAGTPGVSAGNLAFGDPTAQYLDAAGSTNHIAANRSELACHRAIGGPVSGPVWISCLVQHMFDDTTNAIPAQHWDQIRWEIRINNDPGDCLRVGQGFSTAGRTRFVANGTDVNLDRPITLSSRCYLVVLNLRTDTSAANDTVKVWIIPEGTALNTRTEAALNAAAGGAPNLLLTNLDVWSGGVSSLGLFGDAVRNNYPPQLDCLRVIYGLPTNDEMVAAILSGTAPSPTGGGGDLQPGFVSLLIGALPSAPDRITLEYDLKTGWFPNGIGFHTASNLAAASWGQLFPLSAPVQVDRWADMETHKAEFLVNLEAGAAFFRLGYLLGP